MIITATPNGLPKVVFTPDDVKALLLTAAQTQLGLGDTSTLRAYLPSPIELPATAAYVIASEPIGGTLSDAANHEKSRGRAVLTAPDRKLSK